MLRVKVQSSKWYAFYRFRTVYSFPEIDITIKTTSVCLIMTYQTGTLIESDRFSKVEQFICHAGFFLIFEI
jgi:hypothetical protein